MSLPAASSDVDLVARRERPSVPSPRAAADDSTEPSTWGWALIEIRSDGTWGLPRVVHSPDPEEAAPGGAASVPCSILELSDLLGDHLEPPRDDNDAHPAPTTATTRGVSSEAILRAREDYLGPLAHVEALQGDLRRAERHVSQVCAATPLAGSGAGVEHARLAQAWIALERGDFADARLRLDALDERWPAQSDPWLATSRLLLEAKLMIAEGEPEAAIRLLASRRDADVSPPSDWLSDLMTIARAEALIASGEPHRAMATVTPAPTRAAVEAMVVAASARRMLGDVRGAQAVLSRAVTDLDHAPAGSQIEAWLIEARVAHTSGRLDRAHLVMDRALRSAAAEGMRRPLIRDWPWVRSFVELDPELQATHRDFLATCGRDTTRRRTPDGDRPLVPEGSPLTVRESQVLELLAQMYSTEEIGRALYVSSNTVKTHLKGIFGKLGVNRRVDAVRKGRQLGLC